MQTKVQTSRIRSLVDGKVAAANSAHRPATRKPTIAHITIRYFMCATSKQTQFYAFLGANCREQAITLIDIATQPRSAESGHCGLQGERGTGISS